MYNCTTWTVSIYMYSRLHVHCTTVQHVLYLHICTLDYMYNCTTCTVSIYMYSRLHSQLYNIDWSELPHGSPHLLQGVEVTALITSVYFEVLSS